MGLADREDLGGVQQDRTLGLSFLFRVLEEVSAGELHVNRYTLVPWK